MCKIFTLTNTKKIKDLDKAINKIADYLTKSERDGFGYSIQGESGLYGERTVKPRTFKTQFKRPLLNFPFGISPYNRFGTKSKAIGAGIFHGRTSTNDHTLINTHPINKNDWSLIHNGVVTNHGPEYKMLTTNDTEHLVEYLSTTGIKGIEENLTGYYAVSAIDPLGQLHVFKDSTANLFTAYIESIDSMVFATTEDLIENICKDLGWNHSVIGQFQDNHYLIYKNNELISHTTINPKGSTAFENKYSEKSLGRDLNNSYWNDDLRDGLAIVAMNESTRSESEQAFLHEVNRYIDISYTIKDYNGREMTLQEFQDLSDDEKLFCKVIRPDGTIVDPDDMYSEKIYEGA